MNRDNPIPASERRQEIEAVTRTLFADADPDLPVEAAGLVRTLLFPTDGFELSPERLGALRAHMVRQGSPTFFAVLLRGSESELVYTGEPTIEAVFPHADDGHLLSEEELLERPGWVRRSAELWWRGTWSEDAPQPYLGRFQEHILLDGGGAWGIVFSAEDHAFLIADPETSRGLLDAWRMTPDHDLLAYESELERSPEDASEERLRIVAHARDGLWR
jgi:hypothetical protein